MRIIYLNLTYKCNSNCYFCAANVELLHDIKEIKVNKLIRKLEELNITANDMLVLSGGEPLLYDDIASVMSFISQRNGRIILFTNGRLFKHKTMVDLIVNQNVEQISIPIHGEGRIHDFITRSKNSFEETVRGLQNLKERKKDISSVIELKTVICKSNYDRSEETIKTMLSQNVADRILISTLYQTDVASKNKQILNQREIEKTIRSMLDFLIRVGYDKELVIQGVPLCILDSN